MNNELTMEDIRFEKRKKTVGGNIVYEGRLMLGNDIICTCKISVRKDVWSISAWYTSDKYKNSGYGFKTMQYLLNVIYLEQGKPRKIEYIWDGTNDYVFKWMQKHFSPVSKLPIAVQKYLNSDDWDAHIYSLNVDAVLDYFQIG